MNAKQRYDKKYPVIAFRLKKEYLIEIDKLIEKRKETKSEFNRRKYLNELIQEELERLDLI